MKIGYLAAILKRYKYFIFFSWNMVVISVYIYGVKIIKKFRWESGFLKRVPWNPPPYALTVVRGTLCSFSVNKSVAIFLDQRPSFFQPLKRIPFILNTRWYSVDVGNLTGSYCKYEADGRVYIYESFGHYERIGPQHIHVTCGFGSLKQTW